MERRRTGGDVAVGILLVIAGTVLLGDVVFATVVSVRLVGWTTVIAGVVLVVRSLLKVREGGSTWAVAVGGVVLTVLGLFILRNTAIGALTLTLLAGSMLLTTGLVRVFGGMLVPEARVVLVVSGLISTALGLWILLNVTTATLTLLGTLLALQTLLEGVTLLAAGRARPAPARVGAPVGSNRIAT